MSNGQAARCRMQGRWGDVTLPRAASQPSRCQLLYRTSDPPEGDPPGSCTIAGAIGRKGTTVR